MSPLKRKSRLTRSGMPRQQTPMKRSNPERQAKRRKAYKAYLSSAAWKKLRLAVFKRDGWECQAGCGYNGRFSGEPMICDHLTYARFGHENLEDLRTLCRSCNARLTQSERANWFASQPSTENGR